MLKPAYFAVWLTLLAIFMTSGCRTTSVKMQLPGGKVIGGKSIGTRQVRLAKPATAMPSSARTTGILASTETNVATEKVTIHPVNQYLVNTPVPNSGASAQILEQPTAFNTVDLASVLALAGADNWNVEIAKEQAIQARAGYDAARAMWLPDLRWGVGYTGHDGQIQGTNGQVIDVTRQSLFVGGGFGVGNAPLTGGAGGPARFGFDLSLADAIFEPRARHQQLAAAQHRTLAVVNDTMLQASVAYYELVRATAARELAIKNEQDAEQLERLIEAFVAEGKGSPADINRIATIRQRRSQQRMIADGEVQVSAANLAQILQLPQVANGSDSGLAVADATPYPMTWIALDNNLDGLVQQGLASRPEIAQARANACSATAYCEMEQYRPLLPNVYAGTSGGAFGGGPNSNLPKLDGRADVDLIVAWELENLGAGTRSRRVQQSSAARAANLAVQNISNQVATEITSNYHTTAALEQSLQLAESSLREATELFTKDVVRIESLEGMPLELVQTLDALASARTNWLDTVIRYNQSQLRLLRAIGQTPQG